MHTSRLKSVICGSEYGALAGFASSELFILVVCALQAIVVSPEGILYIFLFGQILGVLPSVAVGIVSGSVIAAVLAVWARRLTTRQASLVGFVLAGALASCLVLSVIALQPERSIATRRDLPSLMAIFAPILVLYLASGAWVGRQMSVKLASQTWPRKDSIRQVTSL